MPATTLTSYDEMPYIRGVFPQTHPDRLATLGKLFGMIPPAIDTCSVLELGCAYGDNLIPMALGLPNARFVGIDLSVTQIERGRETIAMLGLKNIELRNSDISKVDAEWGRFDYIICHGTYSWVSERLREKILAICNANLAPDGVSFVSYNTLPGWRMRGMIRDMMVYHASRFQGAQVKVEQARALIDFLSQNAPVDTPYGLTLKSELDRIRGESDAYLFHDHLEEVNEPVYFHQFVESAQRHGLQYLGDATFGTMMSSNFAPQVAETLQRIALDIISMEQYMDFVRNRTFRQTLLIHQDVQLNRNLDGRAIGRLHVSSPAQPVSPAPSLVAGAQEMFRISTGESLTTGNEITKAAMILLAKQWPLGLYFEQLFAAAQARLPQTTTGAPGRGNPIGETLRLGNDILLAYAAGVVELHSWMPRMTLVPSRAPNASPLARLQASRGETLTNLRHEPVALDGVTSQLLVLVDGTRDREALAAAMGDLVKAGTIQVHQNGRLLVNRTEVEQFFRASLEENLLKFAKSALLLD